MRTSWHGWVSIFGNGMPLAPGGPTHSPTPRAPTLRCGSTRRDPPADGKTSPAGVYRRRVAVPVPENEKRRDTIEASRRCCAFIDSGRLQKEDRWRSYHACLNHLLLQVGESEEPLSILQGVPLKQASYAVRIAANMKDLGGQFAVRLAKLLRGLKDPTPSLSSEERIFFAQV